MNNHFEDLGDLVNKALGASLEDFLGLVEEVTDLLSAENGRVGALVSTGRLIEAPPFGELIVIGDLHGDLDSVAAILKRSGFLLRVQRKQPLHLVFLGDYGDRGKHSPEVYYIALSLKRSFPESVILMRGNHEGPDDLLASPHDLPIHLREKFGEDWSTAYARLKELFNHLYNSVVIKDKFVMLHGGVPSRAKSVDDLAYAHLKHPRESHLEEILWSDPGEGIKGICPSPRGAGNIFGEDTTRLFLDMLQVKVLIRGHEPFDAGFNINHSGHILTLFSRKGEPYFNRHAAYLQFNLAREFKDAFGLQRFIQQV